MTPQIFSAVICAAVSACAGSPPDRKLQLELVQQCASLERRSELLVPQFLDRELELLDQEGPRPGVRFRGEPSPLARRAALPAAFFGIPIAHQRITSRRRSPNCGGATDSNPSDQAAPCQHPANRHVNRGIRPVDALTQVAKLCDCHHAIGRQRLKEAAALQPLGVERHAQPMVPKDLDQFALPLLPLKT